MKKFFVKCFALALILFPTILLLNILYPMTAYGKYRHGVSKFSKVPNNIELANLGSSHGTESFDYTGIPYRTFNFALGGQYYLYDYAILKQYIDHFDKGAVVIILVEYFEITQVRTDYSDQISRYHSFLDKQYLPEGSAADYTKYALFPILSAGDSLKSIFQSNKIQTKTNKIHNRADNNYEYILEDAPDRYKSYTETVDTIGMGTDMGFAYNKKLLCGMIEFCLSHGLQPVLVSTPITSVLNSIYDEKSPEFFDTFYRFSREVCAEYPQVPYFDYSHDERFSNDFTLFADIDHLRANGAKKFTPIVVSDIEAAGLLKH
jgi:hypothetical protein